MIKIENVETYGWQAAIRGMRNPKNSWQKSDSGVCDGHCDGHECWDCNVVGDYCIGANDLTLMKTLAAAGTDHGKFMRMITVTLDIVAPLYWWKEFDTYKVGTVADSCSTMHKVAAKAFALNDFSCEHLVSESLDLLNELIGCLNAARAIYRDWKTEAPTGVTSELRTKEDVWWQMIQLLPSSYNQRRTVQLNYAVLKNMYHARKNHKLDEWRDFCKWIETLSYSELITGKAVE